MNNYSIIKSIAALFVITTLTLSAYGQDTAKWHFSGESVLSYNNSVINLNTSFEDISKYLGEPTSEKTIPNGDIQYIYESLGMSISVNAENKVNFVGFNYNWDGDTRFPETSFKGSLSVGNYTVSKASKPEDFEKIKGVKLKCPIPIICISENENSKSKVLIGFKNGDISQIGFTFE